MPWRSQVRDGPAIRAAVVAAQDLRRSAGQRRIHLRTSFVRVTALPRAGRGQLELFGGETGAPGTHASPALPDLARWNVEALRAYLILVFVAHHTCEPGSELGPLSDHIELLGTSTSRPSLQTLLGLGDLTRRNAQVRIQRVLLALERLDLVEIPHRGARRAYSSARVLRERRDGAPYALPGGPHADPFTMRAPQDCLYLPPALFLEGWVHGLSGPELAVLLFFSELRLRFRGGREGGIFYIDRATRLGEYGISDEVYASHRGLSRLGLVEVVAGPRTIHTGEGRVRGFRSIQFQLDLTALRSTTRRRPGQPPFMFEAEEQQTRSEARDVF